MERDLAISKLRQCWIDVFEEWWTHPSRAANIEEWREICATLGFPVPPEGKYVTERPDIPDAQNDGGVVKENWRK